MKILTLVLVGLLLAVVVGAQGKCTPEQREWIQNAGKEGLICEVFDHSWKVSTAAELNKEMKEKGVLAPPPGEERICRICGKKQHLEREDSGAANWVDGWKEREKSSFSIPYFVF